MQPLDNPYTLEARSYVDTLNDSYLTGRDDYLTAGFRCRLVSSRAFVAADYSLLTWKAAHARTDQVGLAAGGIWTREGITLRLGAGVELDGRAGGSGLQNWWHSDAAQAVPVVCAYGRTTVQPLLVAEISGDLSPFQPVLDLAATPRSLDATPALRIGDEVAQFTVGWAVHAGRELSPVARRAMQTMSGPVLGFGLTLDLGGVGPSLGMAISGRTSLLTLGVTW